MCHFNSSEYMISTDKTRYIIIITLNETPLWAEMGMNYFEKIDYITHYMLKIVF